jgi:uncharacterized protein YndB with AHSA1/START domain
MMKYLKYLLGLILLIAIIFFGKGLLTPSIYYESEIVVNKSAEESWAVMSDETKLSQWIKEVKKIELVSGTANTVGAVSKIYVVDGGQEMVMEETIKAVKPNELLSMSFTMDFMNMDYEMRLKEKDGKTTITTKSTTTGNGLFAKSMVSFMTGSMETQENENLINLKTLIEANPTKS